MDGIMRQLKDTQQGYGMKQEEKMTRQLRAVNFKDVIDANQSDDYTYLAICKAIFGWRGAYKKGGDPREYALLINAIMLALYSLHHRERAILFSYFSGETLKQIGEWNNISGARVRQIKEKALRKLKHPSRSRVVGYFYNMVTDEQETNG
jgi:DNA-binding CsgD family transcriptional regulator